MKSLEQLEKRQKKEMDLARQHEQNSSDLKKQIEIQRGNMIRKNINKLNLNADEFQRLMQLLADKKTFSEALSMVRTRSVEKESSQEMPDKN